jgi:hypothetical protein
MNVCSVSADVASRLLALFGTANEAIERHLENPDRSAVMATCFVSADVASKLIAAHGTVHQAIAFHRANPDHQRLVFASDVPLSLRQRVFACNLSVTDRFTGKLLLLALGPDGLPLAPPLHLKRIMRPLHLVKAAEFFFFNSSGTYRHQEQRLDRRYMSAEFHPVELLRCMFGCTRALCRRLTVSPHALWNRDWEGMVMGRVMRGGAGKVQVRRRRAVLCCAVLCCAVLCCAVLCCAVLCV